MINFNSKVLITGSLGFIGNNLVQALNAKNFETFNLNSLKTVDEFLVNTKTPFILKTVDYVYWIGSKITPINAKQNSHLIERELQQLDIIIDLLNRYNPVAKLIFLSSAGAIYTGNDSSFTEESESLGFNLYGKFKKRQEEMIFNKYSGGALILRASNIYGSGQKLGRGQGVIAEWFNSAMLNLPLSVFGNLSIKRDFILVDDLINALLLCMTDQNNSTGVFNVASGTIHSLNEVKSIIEAVTEKELIVNFLGSREVDRQKISISPEKFKSQFKWVEKHSLESGLRLTYERMVQSV
jgi:UDP-glucose 4-epimerase